MQIRPTIALAAVGASWLLASVGASAGTINASFPAPALDRWMYPFNSTPGTRPVISTFGSTPGATDFDSRDGQMLVRFDTAAQVPTGQGSALTVTRATLTVEVANDLVFPYDNTPDPWQCFVATTDPAWRADADAGQPLECFGVGFRNGWTLASFQETSPFTSGGASFLAPGVRNAYAAGFDASNNLIDISQSSRQRFDATAWATGTIDGLSPGSLVPAGSQVRFDLNVSDPNIQAYLRSGINDGRVMLAVSSLTFVQQQSGNFPAFIAKENVYVQLGLASPARLELDVQDGPTCRLGDLNCDGHVNGADLGILLGDWGTSGPGDFNGDHVINGSDLGIMLGEWADG